MTGRQASRRAARGQAGFTLIELIVVLVLLSVVTAIAAPRFAASYRALQADQRARQLRAFLLSARLQAEASGVPHLIRIEAGWSRLTLLRDAPVLSGSRTTPTRQLPASSPFAELALSPPTHIEALIHDGHGLPRGATLDLPLSPFYNDFEIKFRIAVGDASRDVRMAGASGRVTIQ